VNENPNIQVEVTDPSEFHCFKLVLNPKGTVDGTHQWTGCRRGGDPTDAGSAEYVRYCSVCGMEDTCKDPLPPCPGHRIEIMLHARSLVDLIHKLCLALCDWQADRSQYLIEKLTGVKG
jgi:hypothetical protein